MTTVTLGRPPLERHLRDHRDQGRKALVPYVTAGVTPGWTGLVEALADAGADAIEIGLPYSDPMLEGTTIQEASQRALDQGMTTDRALAAVAELDLNVPLVVMTYSNLIRHRGAGVFCERLASAGVSGLIPVDTPLDEATPLLAAARSHGIETVLIVAPSTPPDRIEAIADQGSGFVYASTVMGTTGERTTLGDQAADLATRVRAATDRPVLMGFGISGPQTAAQAARHADGVIMGAAVMRRVLAGESANEVAGLVREVRTALDAIIEPRWP
ncbi:tryptophan synthase subunit alpha [Kineosporia mesophila]|uniref:Tryptophan synthase alpha chain n=1 Tax=Kineosporia mesophila TaxID=566012 RepID=A0ABP6ZJQ7_9ACTN|nr:tryptophan synthase subunit alpha [Kineosporia mesophila]MCD5353483.1 tryptophan synthase subunit alpha [Kineosporia mesophila]